MSKEHRIFLSPLHMRGEELNFVKEAFESNYVGPMVDAFEQEFAHKVGILYAVVFPAGQRLCPGGIVSPQ